MTKVIPVLWVVLMMCLLVPTQGRSEDESNLERINRQVEEESARLEEVSSRQGVIEKNISAQQAEIVRIRAKEDALLVELKAAEDQRLKTQQEVEQGEKRLSNLKALSFRRLKVLYMHRPNELLESLFQQKSSSAVARNALFLRILHDFDRKLMNQIVQAVHDQGQRRVELDGLARKKNLILAGLSSQRGTLEKKVKGLDQLNRDLKNQKEKLSQTLTSLRAQALRLETVVVSLTGGEEVSSSGAAPAEESSKAPTSREPFEGQGLFREKGGLVLPVQGRVVQGYGRQKISDFQDMVFSKGIEYSCEGGAGIQAIARGKVMHVGRMPGYGTIIILDHGERYYSLYGRIGKTEVTVGKVVEKGGQIAQTGEKDPRGRNFYFEIRRNGSPVNPQDYFKRL